MERDNTADSSWQCELPAHSEASENPPSIDGLHCRTRPEASPPVYGIQGGRGSFNEQALNHYVASRAIIDFTVSYLYTTANVLTALNHGAIDFGLFALHNKYGGLVDESLFALLGQTVTLIDSIALPIQHHLMTLPGIEPTTIQAIMAHPQVFRQCARTLAVRYRDVPLQSGDGELIDTACAASALANGLLPPDIAILGPRQLSDIHKLSIVASNLQDSEDNITTFLLVR